MSPVLIAYGALFTAIIFEIIATSCLQMSQQFTKPLPTIIMAICYIAGFYFLSLSLKELTVGIAYALWCAIGIVLISIVGVVVFKQSLDLPAIIGIGFIIAGVVIVQVFSTSATH